MADIAPQPIRWLWRPRIALGKLTIIAGDPGLGKSMLTASLAAHVSTGRSWPDGSSCPSGSVVLVSGEDDAGDTIRPRLDMAGADVTRIHYMQAVFDQRGERGFTLSDVVPLAGLLDSLGDCKLIVVDPVSAYLGGTDSHKNSDVRALLTPLAQLASGHGVSIVAVSHLNKTREGNALGRVTGSLAFVAAARAAYVIARDKENPARRLMLPLKNNLGNDQTGMAYKITEDRGVPYVVWEREPITISAEDALSDDRHDPPGAARNDAADFLTDLLGGGPVSTEAVKAEAKAAGHQWATVRRAKDELQIKARRTGYGKEGAWHWELPESKMPSPKMLTPIHAQVSTFGESERQCGSHGAIDAIGAHPQDTRETEHVCPACAGEGCRHCGDKEVA